MFSYSFPIDHSNPYMCKKNGLLLKHNYRLFCISSHIISNNCRHIILSHTIQLKVSRTIYIYPSEWCILDALYYHTLRQIRWFTIQKCRLSFSQCFVIFSAMNFYSNRVFHYLHKITDGGAHKIRNSIQYYNSGRSYRYMWLQFV